MKKTVSNSSFVKSCLQHGLIDILDFKSIHLYLHLSSPMMFESTKMQCRMFILVVLNIAKKIFIPLCLHQWLPLQKCNIE